jgi:hypothetical protein
MYVRGRSARGLYLASILRAPAKLEILARYSISFLEILAKPKVGVRQAQYLIFLWGTICKAPANFNQPEIQQICCISIADSIWILASDHRRPHNTSRSSLTSHSSLTTHRHSPSRWSVMSIGMDLSQWPITAIRRETCNLIHLSQWLSVIKVSNTGHWGSVNSSNDQSLSSSENTYLSWCPALVIGEVDVPQSLTKGLYQPLR